MAVLRMPDIRKLSVPEAEKKLAELEQVTLELQGEGKPDKIPPVRTAIARLKTYLHQSRSLK